MFRAILWSLLLALSAGASAEGLKVGMSTGYPPLVFVQDGELVGIEADSMRAVSKMLNLKMSAVVLPFDELIPALEKGEIDVIMSGLSVTEERAERIRFIEPYMKVGQMAIVHRDKISRYAQPWSVYADGVRIGVEPGTTGAQFAASQLPDAVLSEYSDPEAAFAGLRKDEIDLYIHDAPTSWQLATTTENDDLISLYSPLTDESLAWAVRQDDKILIEELNSALRTMKANGTLRYILNRWIPVTIEVH